MNKNLLFRSIPKVDILLEEQEIQDLIDAYGREFVMDVSVKRWMRSEHLLESARKKRKRKRRSGCLRRI